MLCLDNTLLMRLEEGPFDGKKSTDDGSSLGISSFLGGLGAQRMSL